MISETRQDSPVIGEYDVVVCGAGPAGIGAALAAARAGARTVLIEAAGCLGGVWTSGLLSFVLDSKNKGGLLREICDRLSSEQSFLLQSSGTSKHYDGSSDFTYDAEGMKHILEALCVESGVEVRLHTRVVASKRENKHIAFVFTESNSGREAFSAPVFIDCSGNGELAARSGCGFDIGHPETGQTQPATMLALISGVPGQQESTLNDATKRMFLETLRRAGVEPTYRSPSLFRLPHPQLYGLMVNHEYGVRCDNAKEMTDATIHARGEIYRIVQALSTLPEWSEVRLVSTASQIGLREGRRVHGLYTVTVQDIVAGARFEDGICLVEFPVDIHALDSSSTEAVTKEGVTAQSYHIPFRSLVAKDVTNLLLAGRCISGDFYAHASYRVTGNAVPMGEAAGLGAALAAKAGISLHELEGREVRERLQNQF
ncbi:FAD-dependent oxidoreductase [Paenibacillus agaridevorans]|nr:FAD-dependent oxidoreductase [Paenibacillus agaridevorans]